MSPKIDILEVRRLAALAKISLSDDEAEKIAVELNSIVGYVEKLKSVKTDQVEPTSQVTGLTDVWRVDEVKPSLAREQLLANAPLQQDGFIKVRRVL